MSERVLIATNADSSAELETTLAIVGGVLGMPAAFGGRLTLRSVVPPFDVFIKILDVTADLITISSASFAVCARLFQRLRENVPGRDVQVIFDVKVRGEVVHYVVHDDTPNEALASIPTDVLRDVPDPRSWRWWIDEGWLTHGEWKVRQKRPTDNG